MSVTNPKYVSCRAALVLASAVIAGLIAACSSSSTPAVPGVGAYRLSVGTRSHVARSPDSAYSVIYSFKGSPDGESPESTLIDVNGIIYGTTFAGGSANLGTMFSIATDGSETVIYSFGSAKLDNSQEPWGRLLDVGPGVWGTGAAARSFCGAIFLVTTAGVESTKYRFKGAPDGCFPWTESSLVRSGAVIYGTTVKGGYLNNGVIFQVTTGGAEKVDYTFGGRPDGSKPAAGLTDVGGTFYGTTAAGGTKDSGTVFSFNPTTGVKVLHNFGRGTDGQQPQADLIEINGKLYGTTSRGGTHGGGTLFSITTAGRERVIYDFGATTTDAALPLGNLVAINGTLYGTTVDGGDHAEGTIYSVTRTGVEVVLHSFGSISHDGSLPVEGLLNVNGTLLGTATSGGANGDGAIYSIIP